MAEHEKEKVKAEAPKNGMAAGLAPTEKRKIKITDPRKVNSWGEPIKKGRGGEYDEDVIKQISLGAIKNGVDPLTAVSLGMWESGLGTYGNDNKDPNNALSNWGQVRLDKWGGDKTPPELMQLINENPDINPHALAMSFVLKKKMGEVKDGDEAKKIQAYNGFRLMPKNDIGGTNMYGIDLSKYPKGYDLGKDPKYGNAIIDVRENIIKQNPELVEYIKKLSPTQQGMSAGFMGK